MALIQPPETFDFSTPNEWPKWRKRFERYLVVSGMKKKEEAYKIDLLMYLIGDRADDIFRTFRFEKEEEATKFDSVLKAFDSHFCVGKNIIYERAKFYSRVQADREPVDEFITSLYKLADSCEFESLHEQLIRDRIVVGVRDKALSERMQLDSELTLEKAVKMVRQQEAVRQQKVDLQRPSTSQMVNQVRFNSRKLSPKQQQHPSGKKEKSAKTRTRCPKCGGFTHREGQACRAEGKRCNLCSKTGHFANSCPDKQAKTAKVKAVSELDEEIGFLLGVSAVADSSNLDDDEGECRRRWTAEIQVNGKQVKFKLDSQADVTCVTLCLFKTIMGQQRLVESNINLRAAEFSELQTVGMFVSTLRNGSYEIKERIYVIRLLSEPLLSRRACELLNLARRIEVVATKIDPIKEFPEVFEGLGQIGGPYEIKLKPGANPYAVHTPRRVPNFAGQYGFTHVASSPRFPQSNGMAEAGVKIAKLFLKKNQDPSLGLLECRSTPLENGCSPAELLMGRKLRKTLTIAPENLNPRTISRRLVANGLHSCRPLRRLPLTPPNRRQRLEWCRARSTWMTEWHRVVFSDESRFCLSSDSRRVRVWRRRGERSNPAAIVECPTVRQRGIMVWGAIAYDSRSPLLRIQGTMTAQRYVDDVLRPVTLPYLQGVPNALYQQDNARPHTARISQQALQDVQMLPWPPYSPDLSPIEHVWDIIGRRLHALPQPRSEDELWQMVEREWRAIPQDAIRTLIDSLPRRVAACIAVRGGPTCY
ncbi:hypothetical protein LAZ67_1004485 [Cordylochernes scorpioides]|uniref:CCHC-type domain-containing protein n=1 Tax=Cordylochernes scorpioides TaxID=51811 RepID=A0ABY6JZ85_9ARAC|nr:hypothetical protein LAZ67_1004485 [Cordylochernes scorpioides]